MPLTIAFDADDTLWHNESVFNMTQKRFRALLADHCTPEDLDSRLLATERRNLALFGYGIKGFTLSMVETAIEVSNATVPAGDIGRLIAFGKEMLAHPVQLLDGVIETLDALRGQYPLMVITKGDLFDQESKIARSGLADRFAAIEIVSEKDEATYRRILDRHTVDPEHFVMIGNSLRSDILPVVNAGGHAIHVPYPLTWAHEHVAPELAEARGFFEAESIGQVLSIIESLRD